MAYIQPNGQIYLLHVDKYNSDLANAPYFTTMSEQYTWFSGKAVSRLTAQSYTRRTKGSVRVEVPMSTAYNINYMMFRNQSFENKWFYAFVSRVEYINDSTTDVYFTIDPIQTWFTGDQATLGRCYVLREHVADDSIGANLEPEPVDPGEMIAQPNYINHLSNMFQDPCIIMAVTQPSDSTSADGRLYNNIYSGCILRVFDTSSTSITLLNHQIDMYSQAGKADVITGMWMCPKHAIASANNFSGGIIASSTETVTETAYGSYANENGFRYQSKTSPSAMTAVYPRNNKLYTYPYNFYRVITGQGNYADYRYEYFESDGLSNGARRPSFIIGANIMQPVSLWLYPRNYKGHVLKAYEIGDSGTYISDDRPYYTEGLTVTGWPQVSWTTDSYAGWMAQNSVPMANLKAALDATNMNSMNTVYATNQNKMNITSTDIATDVIGGVVGAIASAASLNVGGVISNVAGTALNAVDKYTSTYYNNKNNELTMQNAINNSEINLATSQQNAMYSASLLADTMHGTINSGSAVLSYQTEHLGSGANFFGLRMIPSQTRLEKIDHYFDMFGYAVNDEKTPNITCRRRWNYIKTVNAEVSGNMPEDDRSNIQALLDRGIRFWHDHDNMLNYALSNEIVS